MKRFDFKKVYKRKYAERFLALFLTLAMIMPAFSIHVLAGNMPDYIDNIDMQDALHYVVRNWHTANPGKAASDAGSNEGETSLNSTYFVTFKGYIKPNKDNRGNTTGYTLYRTDDVLDSDGNVTGEKLTDIGGTITDSDYIKSWDSSTGTLVMKPVPVTEIDGTKLERFSGFSISTGRSVVNTSREKEELTITYDYRFHLAKVHVFYANDLSKDGYSSGDGTDVNWPNPEQDTTMGYKYTKDDDKATPARFAEGNPVTYDDGNNTGILVRDEDKLNQVLRELNLTADYVEPAKIYNTSEGLHTDKTASVHRDYDEEESEWVESEDGRTFDLELEAWYSEGQLADVGMVLDASGSMAFTTNNPTPIKLSDLIAKGNLTQSDYNRITQTNHRQATVANLNAYGWDRVFLTQDDLDLILDKNKTDNTRLGESGYSYFVYDARTSTQEFNALGYVSDSKGYTVDSSGKKDTSSSTKEAFDPNGEVIGTLDTNYPNGTSGWFYVNHTSTWTNYDNSENGATVFYSGKSYIGIRHTSSYFYTDYITDSWEDFSAKNKTSSLNEDDFRVNLPSGFTDAEKDELRGGTGQTYQVSSIAAGGETALTKFYIDLNGYLRCFFTTGTQGQERYVCSYVYEYPDESYTKAESLQRAVGAFTTRLLEGSHNSRVAATRFSTAEANTAARQKKLVMLDWSSSTRECASIFNLKRGTTPYGNGIGRSTQSTTSDGGVEQYNYGMTGGTATKTGLKAFQDNLASQTANDSSKDKYLIVFTDGKDTLYYDENDTEAVTIADSLKYDAVTNPAGYRIYAVMLTGGPVNPGQDEYAKAKDFLELIASDPSMVYITDVVKAELQKTNPNAETVDALQSIFTDVILEEILHNLKGYTVQDYIDPRFDIVSASGRQWHLNAGGNVVIENTDGSVYGKYSLVNATDPQPHNGTAKVQDGNKWYLPITLSSMKGLKGQSARLYYDSVKDMYYLVWVNQTILGSPVGEAEPKVWNAIVTVRAKDDFLGGNAVLSNGNGAGENMVYHPDDSDMSSGTGDAKKEKTSAGVVTDNYPSKGFPRTTVNVGNLSDEKDLEKTIYMGGTINSETLKTLKNWDSNNQTGYYWEYLERYSQYFYNTQNYNSADEYYEALMSELITNGTLTLPYYYLPDDEDNPTNQTGGKAANDKHESDCLGNLTYTWATEAENGQKFDEPTKSTADIEAEISVTYSPASADARTSADDNGKLVTEKANDNTIYKWDRSYKPEVGTEAGSNTLTGTYIAHIVSGEIMLQMELDLSELAKAAELDSELNGKTITYSADLMREYVNESGETVTEKVGTYTATYTYNGETTGTVTQNAAMTFVEGYEEYVVDYGLPIGTYTLVPNSGTDSGSFALAFTAIENVEITEAAHGEMFRKNNLHTANDGKAYKENPAAYPAPAEEVGGTAYLGTKPDAGTSYLDDLFALFKVRIQAIETGSLEVKKIVSGDADDKDTAGFEFTLTLKSLNPLTTDNFEVTSNIDWGNSPEQAGDYYIYTGTFTLQNGETVKIDKIPAGVEYTIAESNSRGYILSKVELTSDGSNANVSDNTGTGIIQGEATHKWQFTNIPPIELPEAGSRAAAIILILGGMLTALAAFNMRRKKAAAR